MKTSRLFRTAAVLGAAVMFLFMAPTACNSISGVNDLSFEGVPCRENGDCPRSTNECEEATCIEGKCAIVPINGRAQAQVSGDCKIRMCVKGVIDVQPQATDVKMTPTDCDEERCKDGKVDNVWLTERSPCNTSGVIGVGICDGKGQCWECLVNEDCPKSDQPCSIAVCTSDHRCATNPREDGYKLEDLKRGDCNARVCDANGKEEDRTDPTDVPDDKSDCTVDTCTNGGPANTPVDKDSPCGNKLKCDDKGHCIGCNTDADCSASADSNLKCGVDNVCFCEKFTCEGLQLTCGTHSDGCGGTLQCDDGKKNGAEAGIDCGNVSGCAKCANGNACTSGAQCSSGHCADEVCCNTACGSLCQSCTTLGKGYPDDGTCGYVRFGRDPDDDCQPGVVSECGLSGYCNGAGACAKYENGTACMNAACNGFDYRPVGVCANGLCNAPEAIDCSAFGCDEAGCLQPCSSDVDCTIGTYCTNGNCRPKKQITEECDGPSACLEGQCVDGYCCESACTDACMACNVAGSLGRCQFVPQNMPDVSTCVMPEACDGLGVCKKATGQPCAQNAECSSTNCVDGFCCNTSCAETCRACNVLGSIGTCTTVPVGQPDGNTCQAPGACSGFGACLKGQGALCAIGSECSSGYCFDGVCCNSECKEACKACNVAGTAGTCTNVPMGQTDPGLCPAPRHCDGMGVCVQ